MTINKEDIDITTKVIEYNLKRVNDQIVREKPNWDAVTSALRNIRFECNNTVLMMGKERRQHG